MQRGERSGVRDAIDRTAKRLRDSGAAPEEARRKAIKAARTIERKKER